MSKLFYSIGILLLLVACQDRLEKHGELFSVLMKSHDGLFRGIELGQTRTEIEQVEGVAPDEAGTNYLIFNLETGITGNASIRYGFESGLLMEILVSADFDDKEEGIALLSGFRSYFSERFGMYEKEGGYLVWKGNAQDNPDAMIEMIDESELSDFGQFSLTFYKSPAAPPYTE
jgi:hypothetical protein